MSSDYNKDKILLKAIQTRKPDAFEYLREQCIPAVEVMINTNNGSLDDLEDTYNEGVVSLLEIIENPDKEIKRGVLNLFVVICRNKWLTHISKQESAYKYSKNLKDDYDADYAAKMDERVERNIYERNFEKLKEDCQRILDEYLNGISFKEIADKLGLTPMYVKKKKHYCYKNLLLLISEDPEYKSIQWMKENKNI